MKAFCWIAGQDDSDASLEAFKKSKAWRRYFRKHPERFLFINHATGHRPTPQALDAAWDYLSSSAGL